MSFTELFWTQDYHLGYEVLFDVLFEGVKENEDFIRLFNRRMDLELQYGLLLEALPLQVKPLSKRHTDDDYASTIKNAFAKMNENFSSQGKYHVEVAENIQELVLNPFLKWCKEHEQRIGYSEVVITEKFKQYKSSKASLEKLQTKYFNKCRMLEEFRSRFSDDELTLIPQDETSFDNSVENDDHSETETELNENTYTFAGAVYDHKNARKLLGDIISNIELRSHKVPIIGKYFNVSSGSEITQWLLDNMPEFKGNIARAEAFGQDLIENKFIRLIGSMNASKNFINSSQFFYQWKPYAFEFTKLVELDQARAAASNSAAASNGRTAQLTNYLEDVKQAIGVSSIDFNDKSQYPKLLKLVESLDKAYFDSTKTLDKIRCDFEEVVMDHLAFMGKCELDRLKAIKKVTFDFLSIFSNKWAAVKNVSDELFVVEETIHPLSDLKILIENYATGKFEPHVTLYDNYYNSNIKQTFGVDLNVKARLDRKAVPSIIQATLSCLDNIYPELADDSERVNLWTEPVHLSNIHELRFQLNELTEVSQMQQVLIKSEPKVITNVLKLYFMELPDSIVPHSYFDLIMTLYNSYPVESKDESVNNSRLTGLQNTLLELPVCSLATLDAILTHLNRLVKIIATEDENLGRSLRSRLCKEFGPLVLRPKAGLNGSDGKSLQTTMAVVESTQQSFIADLFSHKDAIFGELRRRNSSKPISNSRKSTDHFTSEALRVEPGTDKAKARLESKMKRAVTKASARANPDESEATKGRAAHDIRLSTPPPSSPIRSESESPSKGYGLKRSTSPNKKKLSSFIDNVPASTSPPISAQDSLEASHHRKKVDLPEKQTLKKKSKEALLSTESGLHSNEAIVVD